MIAPTLQRVLRPYDGRILLGLRWLERTLDLFSWTSWGVELHGEDRFPFPRALGDLDGDGFADLGFRREWSIEPAAILFGGHFGTPDLPEVIDVDAFDGCRTSRIHPDLALGSTALPPNPLGSGDFDGDGNLDLVVFTSTQPDPELPAHGIVYLVPGSRPYPSDIRLADVGTALGTRIRASGPADDPAPGSRLGGKFAAADFDGDGKYDLVLVTGNLAFQRDGTNRHAPAVLVLFGRESWPLDLDAADPAEPGICRLVLTDEAGRFGGILEVPGDLTGDGIPDLLVSASMGDEGGCHLVSGARLAPGLQVIEDVRSAFFTTKDGQIEKMADLGDWDADGRRDLAFGFPGRGAGGSVVVVPLPDPLPARMSVDASFPGSLEVTGTAPDGFFGKALAALDIDGDGRREIVATAPGFFAPDQPEVQSRGRLVILHGESEYLGPLEGANFSPRQSSLRGDGSLRISGRGFDAGTEVHLGDTPLEVIERTDSRTITARIPPRDGAGAFPVRLVRGTASYQFPDPFTYYDGVFPAEIDIHEIGDGWCTIASPFALRWYAGEDWRAAHPFDAPSRRIRGGREMSCASRAIRESPGTSTPSSRRDDRTIRVLSSAMGAATSTGTGSRRSSSATDTTATCSLRPPGPSSSSGETSRSGRALSARSLRNSRF